MGVETAIIGSLLLSGVSAFSQVQAGKAANKAAQQQANLALAQAESRAAEEERVAQREARLESEAAEDQRKKQKVAFLASGVDLEGSPLLVLEETRQRGLDNVNEILSAGKASQSAIRDNARANASQLQASGRQAFMSGISGATGTLASGIGSASSAGLFSSGGGFNPATSAPPRKPLR